MLNSRFTYLQISFRLSQAYIFVMLFTAIHLQVNAQDTIKLMSYNLLNYYDTPADSATRNESFRTIIRHTEPEIIACVEIKDQASADAFLNNVLKPVNPDYDMAPYFLGPNTSGTLYYKAGRFSCISNTPIQTTLRDINHFVLKHEETEELFHLFLVHLKASSGVSNEQQRLSECDSLRKASDLLSQSTPYIVCGDFNFYGSTEPAYQRLLQVNAGQTGHFLDVFTMPGIWNDPTYAEYHTQSPRVRSFGGGINGGMDDRFDLILLSQSLMGGGPIEYSNGSMQALGNDGNHYNDSINALPNNAVPAYVAQALHDAADHLPVLARFVFVNGSPSSISKIQKDKLLIYPQPASDFLFGSGQNNTEKLYLYNSQGYLLRVGYFPLYIGDLNDGMYFLDVKEQSVQKVIIHSSNK